MIHNLDNDQEEILEPLSKMTAENKSQYIADVKVMNYLLQAIPNDIYNSIDACKNGKEMWERIKRLMFGSKVTSHVRHSRLMDEFDKFAAKEGESLESVYERLTTLMNIIDRTGNDESNQIVQRVPRTESTTGKANVLYGYVKNHKKTVKNGQTRTRETEECARAGSQKVKPWSTEVNH
ncbi:hypothetical protein Tco_1471933 [Tanacetum coccineum]